MAYRNRTAAGVALAAALAEGEPLVHRRDAIVLGVPRGGVVVAAEVAATLGLPLDIALARKLGAPGNPELAVGAVAEGGAVWLNRPLMHRLRLDDAWAEMAVAREQGELERRAARYRSWPAPQVEGRVVVVVDDGVATGATLAAVLQALGQRQPDVLVCAVPVAPPETVPMLAQHCDRVVCPLQPRGFQAVGIWYDDFRQTRDEEVVALLAQGREPPVATGGGR
jgi:putative phosphoribosyl transferase